MTWTTTRLNMFYCKCATKLGLEKMLTGHSEAGNIVLVLSIPRTPHLSVFLFLYILTSLCFIMILCILTLQTVS